MQDLKNETMETQVTSTLKRSEATMNLIKQLQADNATLRTSLELQLSEIRKIRGSSIMYKA